MESASSFPSRRRLLHACLRSHRTRKCSIVFTARQHSPRDRASLFTVATIKTLRGALASSDVIHATIGKHEISVKDGTGSDSSNLTPRHGCPSDTPAVHNPHVMEQRRRSVSTAYFQKIAGPLEVSLLEQSCVVIWRSTRSRSVNGGSSGGD